MNQLVSLQRHAAVRMLPYAELIGDVAAHAGAARAAGGKRAVLIGIDHWQSVPGLQGSVYDVETMRKKMLVEINQLVRESGPDDAVCFHYSGHGSQVQEVIGDEADGREEAIVPQEGRSRTESAPRSSIRNLVLVR